MQHSHLITSKARLAILAHTLLAPGQEFYLRELVRLTGLAPRTIQVALDQLVRAGLLIERRHGNRRYLRAQKGHPLFVPLREIVLKTAGMVPSLREALGHEGIRFALLFGSVAAGTPGPDSDIDLLVVGTVGLRPVVRRLRPVQERLGREINPVVWTPDEYRRRWRQHDPFIKGVLEGPHLMVVGDEDDASSVGGERLAP